MTIIDRVRADAARQLQGLVSQSVSSVLPGLLGSTVAGAIGRGISGGRDALKSALPPISSAPDLVLGEIARRQSPQKAAQDSRQAAQLLQQQNGRGGSSPGPSGIPTPVAGPTGTPPTKWTAAPVFGGLTLERYRQFMVESAMTEKAWKNLFHVSIEEFSASKESPNGAGLVSLLALDVSFGPCTMPGESVAMGGANLDKLETTDRVELRLTTFDDSRGTIKRWFTAKCDQAAHTDGTMGLPADYLVVVTVTHMDPLNQAPSDTRMRHKWLMRPASIDSELSRRAPELEELQMSFVQFDTFMVPR